MANDDSSGRNATMNGPLYAGNRGGSPRFFLDALVFAIPGLFLYGALVREEAQPRLAPARGARGRRDLQRRTARLPAASHARQGGVSGSR
jgi:hypothetical protein